MSEPTSRRDFLVVTAGSLAAAGCGDPDPSSVNAAPEGDPLNFPLGSRAPTSPSGGIDAGVCTGSPPVLFIEPAALNLGLNQAIALNINKTDNTKFPKSQGKPVNLYVCRTSEGLVALDVTCTHLGCFPDFVPDQALFHCHCHNSQYTLTGALINGPAPLPLPRFAVCKGSDGLLHIDLSKPLP